MMRTKYFSDRTEEVKILQCEEGLFNRVSQEFADECNAQGQMSNAMYFLSKRDGLVKQRLTAFPDCSSCPEMTIPIAECIAHTMLSKHNDDIFHADICDRMMFLCGMAHTIVGQTGVYSAKESVPMAFVMMFRRDMHIAVNYMPIASSDTLRVNFTPYVGVTGSFRKAIGQHHAIH